MAAARFNLDMKLNHLFSNEMNVHSSQSSEVSKQDHLLDAALAVFAERGYHGSSMPELARRAGVAAATIYRYFDSKDLLVNALYRREKKRLMAHLLPAIVDGGDARALFGAFWLRLARYARDHATSFAFLELHHHADYLDSTSLALELHSLLPIAELLQRARAAGITNDLPTPAQMALVWGAIIGLVKAQRLGALELTDELIERAGDSCWNALRRTP